MSRSFVSAFVWVLLVIALPRDAMSHAPEQSYLYLRIYESHITGTIEITSDDLNKALDLGLERGMAEVDMQAFRGRIEPYLRRHVKLFNNGQPLGYEFTDTDILTVRSIGDFWRFNFDVDPVDVIPEELDVEYSVLFDKDDKHKGLLVIGHNWKSGIIQNEGMTSLVFSRGSERQTLLLGEGSLWQGFKAMVKLGMWHIWIGLDHILFLVALILPSVVRRRRQEPMKASDLDVWSPVDRFKPAFIYIVKIVTFFTIAHSITLSLAALGVVSLSSRLVESIIALSIALAAYHNIRPIFGHREWLIAFLFGLFHGFGFASVLGDKGLAGEFMTLSLLGFNVGVEIGQVAIICAIFPVLYFIRRKSIYPKVIFYGSIALIAIALYWFAERSLDVNFLIDDFVGKWYAKGMGFLGLR